jgi:hypothetical protein
MGLPKRRIGFDFGVVLKIRSGLGSTDYGQKWVRFAKWLQGAAGMPYGNVAAPLFHLHD